jgi:hypothetical protein
LMVSLLDISMAMRGEKACAAKKSSIALRRGKQEWVFHTLCDAAGLWPVKDDRRHPGHCVGMLPGVQAPSIEMSIQGE